MTPLDQLRAMLPDNCQLQTKMHVPNSSKRLETTVAVRSGSGMIAAGKRKKQTVEQSQLALTKRRVEAGRTPIPTFFSDFLADCIFAFQELNQAWMASVKIARNCHPPDRLQFNSAQVFQIFRHRSRYKWPPNRHWRCLWQETFEFRLQVNPPGLARPSPRGLWGAGYGLASVDTIPMPLWRGHDSIGVKQFL
ncbi:hypothetical protein ATE71_21455 [Sphingopyxis sp. H115]|nr:hypothetical protein ATE71_21455 [Sphingopyxis sp. H115]